MFRYRIPPHIRFFAPFALLASFGGAGYLRPASGSWGSAFALAAGYIFLLYFNIFTLIFLSIALFMLGLWASARWLAQSPKDSQNPKNAQNTQSKEDKDNNDPSAIVIDEAVGMWLTMACLPHPTASATLATAFILFRFFDIVKPYPVGAIEKRVKGAMGIMLDDVVAAFLAIGTGHIVLWLIGRGIQIS